MRLFPFTLAVALTFVVPSFAFEPRLEPNPEKEVTIIAFASCARQDRPQPIWQAIIDSNPELFLFIGDNIYGDTEDMAVMREKYGILGQIEGFATLRRSVPIMATWDDHDYGVNDGGAEYPMRAESQVELLDFFGEPANSPRRAQEGVYEARILGPEGRRLQIILLDTRYHRSELATAPPPPGRRRGPYIPQLDPDATMLGEAQWEWLEEQLRQPAELRIIASSIQVVPEDHPFEKWSNIPAERERLFALIRDTGAQGVFFLSGDRHLAELSMMDGGLGYPVYDLTASGMNNASPRWRPYEVNQHRVGTMNWGNNFGVVMIDWEREDPRISLQIRDEENDIIIQRKIFRSTLTFPRETAGN